VLNALIQGSALAGFLFMGGLAPRDRTQGLVTSDTAINVVNGLMLFGLRVTLIAWIASHCDIGLVDTAVINHPFIQFGAAFLILDFSRYWLHRAHHRVPWLWTFHRVHHMTERLDATAGLRMHVVDFLQLAMLPVVLFSAVLNVSSWAAWVLPAALSVGAVADAFQHANLRWNSHHPVAKLWGLVFNHPHFHAWHHTRDGSRCDGNYGNTLVVWDRMFGSDVTGDELPAAYGLESNQALSNHVLGMHLLRSRTP
jgi:sterol desaturase/sphingolipid hydroxylase (fatty acid hydroxylase superfamily)